MSENASRRIYYLAAIAIVAIVLISAVAVTRPLNIQTGSSQNTTKTLQVTGQGTVSASPDQAILRLAVQTQAPSASQATSDNAAIMSKVFDALVNAGLGKDSIQTASYSLTPIYENKPDQTTPPKVLGYDARNVIQVTIINVNSTGKILDTAVMAGVNEVQGISFTLSSSALAALQRQATQLALRDADAQAKAIASAISLTLVGPVSISPGYSFQPRYETMTLPSSTPIQPGTLQVTAIVQVTYRFA